MQNRRCSGLSVVEVVFILILLAIVVATLLPILAASRHTAWQMSNGTGVRGIQGAMVLYAQANNNYYPGWNGRDFSFTPPKGWMQGPPDGRDVSQRFALLLLNSYFTGEYVISPAERDKEQRVWTKGAVTTFNYSYCLLQLPSPESGEPNDSGSPAPLQISERLAEWSQTINTLAPVVCDRSNVTDPTLETTSLWVTSTTTAPSDWRGSVGCNDNHVSFATSATLETTKYGSVTNTNDDLFTATSESDALMIYGGK